MSKVYVLGQGPRVELLRRIPCKNESTELQDLLEKNPELLPSDQIFPADPPQWLLVKREMPVSDPATGMDRWSIDFLFVDHMAIPTLVECKRCADTRSRREVIAQMLEYAANGHHYWTAEDLQSRAQEAAGGLSQLESWVGRCYAPGGTPGEFFEAVVSNLRKATMRLIFFLEDSPNELRSLVEFLNGQLKETEVLIVEARLYESTTGRIVVPTLFGYTEQARVAKKESRTQAARQASPRGESAFLTAITQGSLPPEVESAVASLLREWPTQPSETPYWSFGANAIFMIPSMLRNRGLFQVGRDGNLSPYFGYWHPEAYADVGPEQIKLRERFTELLQRVFDLRFTDKQLRGYPTIKVSDWLPKKDEFVAALHQLAEPAGGD